MTFNQVGGAVVIVALAVFFVSHVQHPRPAPVPKPAPVVVEQKPPESPVHHVPPAPVKPKPTGPVIHPDSHSVRFGTYREVQAHGRVGQPITCKSVEPVPEEDVATYAKQLSLTEAQVRQHRVCVQ